MRPRGGSAGGRRMASISGRASARASASHVGLHAEEVEQHVQLVAVLVTEEATLLGRRQVDLAEQDRVAGAARQEGAQVAQVVVRVELHLVEGAVRLEQERHGVDTEPGQSLRQPEPDELADLLAHGEGGDVEVGLMAVEAVQVVLAGLGVVGPHALLATGEHHTRRAVDGISSRQT